MEELPTMEELGETPSKEELSKAMDNLPSDIAPGLDGIPAEVIKSAKGPLREYLYIFPVLGNKLSAPGHA